jgi:methylmalonyl-CoA/ethylmalonyl-CoA epimerase
MHHVGIATKDLVATAKALCVALGMRWNGHSWDDPIQKVRVAFLEPAAGGSMIELVQALSSDAPVARFQATGTSLYHICFEVNQIEAEVARLRADRALILQAPVPAVAFDNRRIAWVYLRQRILVELVERESA